MTGQAVSWDRFDQLKQQLASGDAAAVVEPLQALRQQWPEPALATLLADALAQLGRPQDALACLQADIEAGIDNHWTHYTLGHHLAQLGQLPAAAAAFRRCHALQGWTASEDRGYTFTHDYFSGHIPTWRQWFAELITITPIRILEIGSWQGGSTLWLLDHVIAPRGGSITCIDTWAGSSEHTFLAPLGLSLEALFDSNVDRTGLADHVHKIKGRSQDVLPAMPAAGFDLIYIDGAHEAEAVIQDAIHAHRLLAPGGFLLFDDLNYTFADPAQNTANAIDFFCRTFAGHYRECHRGAQLLLQRDRSSRLPERLLLVLGMHRSGTSALSGLLCQQGFTAPAHPDPAGPANPTGYWEAPAVRSFHNALLEEGQSSWDDLLLPADLGSPRELPAHLHRLEQALQQDFPALAAGQIALVKDPRQCRLFPLWSALIEHHQLQAAAVLAVRHPLAVALSLQRRDNLPMDRSLLLWLAHTLEAERHSRSLERVVVVYEQMLHNPAAALKACRQLVGLQALEPDPELLQRWIRPELNHAELGSSPFRGDLSLLELALDVYNHLAAVHGAAIEPELACHLDQAHNQLQERLDALARQSSRREMLQLFWDPADGGGFSEDNSLRSSVAVDRGLNRVDLRLPAAAAAPRALRLDPAEQPGLINLQRLQLLTPNGLPLWQWQAGESPLPFAAANPQTVFLPSGELLAASHDPALHLAIPAAVLEQISEGCRLHLEARWQHLPADLAKQLLDQRLKLSAPDGALPAGVAG